MKLEIPFKVKNKKLFFLIGQFSFKNSNLILELSPIITKI